MKNKKIYIQYNGHRPYNHECSCAIHGAIDLECQYEGVEYKELEAGLYDDYLTSNLFVGTVEFMNEVFRRIGLDNVRLPRNSNRKSKIMTLNDARKLVGPNKSIFIKPVAIKLFTGFVLDESHYVCLDDVPGDTLVYVYKPFKNEIVSEWRVYVNDGKIELCTNYSGDPLKSINEDDIYYYLDECINYKPPHKFPKTFVIDIGVINGPHHPDIVIEYNDMWGIGNYGLNNDIYVEMLYKRYFELIANTPLPVGDVLVITKLISEKNFKLRIEIKDWDKSDILDLASRMDKNVQFYIENKEGKLIKLNL